MELKCIVVDDDEVALNFMSGLVNRHDGIVLLEKFQYPLQAVEYLNENGKEIDVVFLDIEMPKLNGVDLANLITNDVCIVFTTSNREHALDAFDLHATDYLLKPVRYSRFCEAVEQCRARLNSAHEPVKIEQETIFIKSGTSYINLDTREITHVESMGDYVAIFHAGKRHVVLGTMSEVLSRLGNPNFIRVHRSFLINLRKVERIEGSVVYIEDVEIPLGKSYKKAVIDGLRKL